MIKLRSALVLLNLALTPVAFVLALMALTESYVARADWQAFAVCYLRGDTPGFNSTNRVSSCEAKNVRTVTGGKSK